MLKIWPSCWLGSCPVGNEPKLSWGSVGCIEGSSHVMGCRNKFGMTLRSSTFPLMSASAEGYNNNQRIECIYLQEDNVRGVGNTLLVKVC